MTFYLQVFHLKSDFVCCFGIRMFKRLILVLQNDVKEEAELGDIFEEITKTIKIVFLFTNALCNALVHTKKIH